MNPHPVVTPEAWLEARRTLLAQEKALTRTRDALAAQRRALPWLEITKEYEFEGPDGRVSLAGLFAGRSQLIVQHFMFGPGWKEGCLGCSFLTDHADSANQHLRHHDVTLVAVSRAPLADLMAYRARMGWQIPWYSSFGSDFNFDFNVSFTPEQRASGKCFSNYQWQDPGIDEVGGHSVFYRDSSGRIHLTYSAFERGDELLLGAYNYLDITPFGRNENGPAHNLSDWVRHHDRYDSNPQAASAAGPAKGGTSKPSCGCDS